MTASGTKIYSGIYKARCVSVSGTDITAYIPQMFGDVKVTMQSAIGTYPLPGTFGYVVFEGGDPAFPIWAGSAAATISSTDEPLHVAVTGATKEPIGHTDSSQSTISFNNSTRTFTISPVGDYFEVWCIGSAYRKTAAETVVVPNTTGLYYIYYSSEGILSCKNSFFTWDSDTPTAYVYWNSVTAKAEFFADERHGVTLDWATHEYLHRTRGAVIASGFDASNYVIGGNGSLDTHAQLDISNGTFFDEDNQVDIVHSNTPTANTWQQDLQGPAQIPVMYRSGTGWVVDSPTNFPMKQGTTTIQYNTVSGGTWSTTDVANNSYMPMFIVATNNLNYPVLAVMGQYTDSNLGKVQEYLWTSMDLTNIPTVEFRLLYKVIVKALTGAANTPKAAITEIDDLRVSQVSPAALSQPVSTVPTGSLTAFAGTDAPTGWLMCYGQTVSRSTYASLFAVIGTTYGTGDGSTTFHLPDLRGRVAAGKDDMGGSAASRLTASGLGTAATSLGAAGGTETHILITSQMPSHTHIQDAHTHTQNAHTHTQNAHTHTQDAHGHSAGYYDGAYTITNAAVAAGGDYQGIIVHGVGASSRIGVNNNTATNQNTTATNQNTTATNQNTGGGLAHPNTQPTIVFNYIIKT